LETALSKLPEDDGMKNSRRKGKRKIESKKMNGMQEIRMRNE
jgi:hypothetical protein